jgi:hypothetical protein
MYTWFFFHFKLHIDPFVFHYYNGCFPDKLQYHVSTTTHKTEKRIILQLHEHTYIVYMPSCYTFYKSHTMTYYTTKHSRWISFTVAVSTSDGKHKSGWWWMKPFYLLLPCNTKINTDSVIWISVLTFSFSFGEPTSWQYWTGHVSATNKKTQPEYFKTELIDISPPQYYAVDNTPVTVAVSKHVYRQISADRQPANRLA